MTFLIVLFVLIMQFLWMYIDELVGKGLGFFVILEFLGWGSATLFPLALPLATLLASIMTMGDFGEHNELLAMKAAGISLTRIMAPLVVVAVIISIGAFLASDYLLPVAYKKIFTLRDDITKTKEEIKIPDGIFYNGIDGYSLRVKTTNPETNMMHDVIVYDHSAKKGNISVIVADSGLIKISPDKSNLIFTLYNGTSFDEDNVYNINDTLLKLNRVNFIEQEVVIELNNYAFEKSDDNRYASETRTKSLKTLKGDRDSLERINNNMIGSQVQRVLANRSLSHSGQLSDSISRASLVGNVPYDTLFKWEIKENQLRAYNVAKNNINNQISNIDYYNSELNSTAFPLRRNIIESFRKYTVSFACLLFFFIGAPIGAIIRKGGLGTPVIISMFFFMIYWVIDISGKKLADNGEISPFVGTFISSFVLLPLGAFLTWKSTKDSTLFNITAYLDFFKKLFTRFNKKKKWEQE